MTYPPSFRAQLITRRTYNRPLDDAGETFETWDITVDRVICHQRWLWERAKGSSLTREEYQELDELALLMLDRKVSVSGRTLWLGGTDVAKTREASQFNCSFGRVETVHDVVDAFWLLLQGCGVGFEPVVGTLNGFTNRVSITVNRSTRKRKGRQENKTSAYDQGRYMSEKVWVLEVGDSAEAWSKAVGKLLAFKDPVSRIILDFSQVRPAGERLKGYGWLCSGDGPFAHALEEIAKILNTRAGQLLSRIDILDILNHLGTTLSSRRSAEIAFVPYGDPEEEAFTLAKKDHWTNGKEHRAQSNNSLLFYKQPSKFELYELFRIMQEAGGSEPGLYNADAALKRAPWFKGSNPCGEILLGNKSFCNLVEVDLGKFNGDLKGLKRAVYLAARANYRQTCVNLDDGVLQRTWHELNQFLRLCGVGLTGIVRWEHSTFAQAYELLRLCAREGAHDMADELGLPRAKAVTTVKPSGTLSKIMDTTEGLHKPLGKYILNNVNFSRHDKLVPMLREAGYRVFDNPYDPTGVLVTLPVSYDDVEFDKVYRTMPDGRYVQVEVNLESAIDQLERYKLIMLNYCDHNASVTISYSPDEVPAIVDWLDRNWDSYVGVSFLYRNDPSKTAADLGYPYLPQEVVDEETFNAYVVTLKPLDIDGANGFDEYQDAACATGACPIK